MTLVANGKNHRWSAVAALLLLVSSVPHAIAAGENKTVLCDGIRQQYVYYAPNQNNPG